MLMGIWRVTGSTRLQDLAARSIITFNSMPSGNKRVGIHNTMGIVFVSKFNGTLVELVKGMLRTGPTNAQKDARIPACNMQHVGRWRNRAPSIKKGAVSNPGNYRMIAVSGVMYRIYANVLKNLVNDWCVQKKGFLTINLLSTLVGAHCIPASF
eukprot:1146549-Pelagomonas_calceolata.AAC.2